MKTIKQRTACIAGKILTRVLSVYERWNFRQTACIAGKILTRVFSVYERWNFRQWQRKSSPAHSPRVFAAAKTVALVVERTRSRTQVTSCLLGGYREKEVGRW